MSCTPHIIEAHGHWKWQTSTQWCCKKEAHNVFDGNEKTHECFQNAEWGGGYYLNEQRHWCRLYSRLKHVQIAAIVCFSRWFWFDVPIFICNRALPYIFVCSLADLRISMNENHIHCSVNVICTFYINMIFIDPIWWCVCRLNVYFDPWLCLMEFYFSAMIPQAQHQNIDDSALSMCNWLVIR